VSGRVKDDTGKLLTGITRAAYSEQEGGAPLFVETQNVQLEAAGRFTVLLGATKSQG
jgi:trimeric autotransporter adhesin